MSLSPEAVKLFKEYAEDAINWSGTPPVGGNVENTPERNGYLTALKKENLLFTELEDSGIAWIHFTAKGKAFAAQLGLEVAL